MRKIKFQTENIYHIYNRGVDKRQVFKDENDYTRFLESMREFNQIKPIGSLQYLRKIKENNKKKMLDEQKEHTELGSLRKEPSSVCSFCSSSHLVDIICYCLNPNHYHLLLRQSVDQGISKFIHKLSLGYTNYFNLKNNRTGSLFQGKFQAIEVKSDAYLEWLSCYINGNNEIHKIGNALVWPWSSCPDYLNKRNGTLCDKNLILKNFKNIDEYKNLLQIAIKESSERKDEIKKYYLEMTT